MERRCKHPVFAEAASVFTIMDANGVVRSVDENSAAVGGCSPLQLLFVSMGAFGIATFVTLEFLKRPWATKLLPSMKSFGPLFPSASILKSEFIDNYAKLLTRHIRVESSFNPYADNFITKSFLALKFD